MQFPTDLSDRYYMSLTFYKYERPNPFSLQTRLIPINQSEGGSIRLPLPANLTDSLNLNWEQVYSSLPIQAIDAGTKIAAGNTDNSDVMVGAAKGFQGFSALNSSNKLLELLGKKDTIDQALQFFGLAQNPALTMLFKHPEFKTHSFAWKLSPNNENETITLTKIIRTITRAALPSASTAGLAFTYPDICQINISNNTHLYSFQPAVILNITSNYAPTGIPSFYAGTKGPSEVVMSLSFKEIILNTRENFDGTTGSATPYQSPGNRLIGFFSNARSQLNNIIGGF